MERSGAGASRLPSNAEEFGRGLRELRTQGLRRLAAVQESETGYRVVLSKTQLHRYETGNVLPPLQYAEHLDRLYGGEGWLEVALRSLWRSKWDPWAVPDGGMSQYHSVLWPAQYRGVVWLKLIPSEQTVQQPHRVHLEWGPWMRDVMVTLPAKGVLLFTGKAPDADGIPRTCNVSVDRQVYLLHGAGDDFDDEVRLDLRRGWRVAPGETGDSPAPGSE